MFMFIHSSSISEGAFNAGRSVQWDQRSEEGHWVEEEYFQESKNLLEKVEEDLYQGTFNIWQLWIERRHLTVSYIGEATVPVSVVQCQYGG